jgi:hypothetical protein
MKKILFYTKNRKFQQVMEECFLQLELVCLIFNLKQMACWFSSHFLHFESC